MTKRDTVIAAIEFLEGEHERQANMVCDLKTIADEQFGLSAREAADLAACVKDRDQLRTAIDAIRNYMDLPITFIGVCDHGGGPGALNTD